MWFKEAISWCVFMLLLSLEVYNGYYVDRVNDVTLFYTLWQLCEVLLAVSVALRPKGLLMWLYVLMSVSFFVQFHQSYKGYNFEITVTDYVVPTLIAISVVLFCYNRYRIKRKRYADV